MIDYVFQLQARQDLLILDTFLVKYVVDLLSFADSNNRMPMNCYDI